MMQPAEVCSGLLYEYSSFDEYWEGTKLRTNATINEVNRDYVELMTAIGLARHHNLLVSLPFVSSYSTDPTGGRLSGVRGISDLSLFLKSEWIYKPVGKGNLSALTSLGFMTPVSNYNADYRPYAIGFGATEFSLRGILEYEFDAGFYLRTSAARVWRGQAEVDRDSYYQDGEIYYTNRMDVPNAWHYQFVVGKWFFHHGLKVQATYTALNSTSGDDIRAFAKPQPTNEVDAGQVGALAQVYLNKPAGLGALAYWHTTISGRNAGKSTHFGLGVTYIINFKGKPSLPKPDMN